MILWIAEPNHIYVIKYGTNPKATRHKAACLRHVGSYLHEMGPLAMIHYFPFCRFSQLVFLSKSRLLFTQKKKGLKVTNFIKKSKGFITNWKLKNGTMYTLTSLKKKKNSQDSKDVEWGM